MGSDASARDAVVWTRLSSNFESATRVPFSIEHAQAYLRRLPDDLFLVVGEIHNKRRPIASETPQWLTIPERALFTGTAIVGAIGTGKTSCCMYPFAEQILAYRAADKEKKIGGLVLEVKGDFCLMGDN